MGWWVITTGPAQERRAVSGLADAGFLAWCPMRKVRFRTRHMRTASEREYPTFPGYVFARPAGVVPIWRWEREVSGPEVRRQVGEDRRDVEPREARMVDGVQGFLASADGRPLLLRDDEFDRVRSHLDALSMKPVDAQTWRVNDLARIADVDSHRPRGAPRQRVAPAQPVRPADGDGDRCRDAGEGGLDDAIFSNDCT